MNKLFLLLFTVSILFLTAQDEYLAPLGANTNLYYQTKEFQNIEAKDFVKDNVVITADSISLPFIDDFSTNTLKPFGFNEIHIYDTILYATGTCINTDFDSDSIGFHTSQSYYYFYDVANSKVDSIIVNPIDVYDFSSTNCFPNVTSITSYWAPYYRSVETDFNTTTGEKLDSTIVTPDVTINIAKIYFANMPKDVNWMDNFAWWNTTNPIEPISIGVATLDGLNEFGLPYNNTVTNAYGIADYLTSKPIDLSLLGASDDVYLSFFYQAGGLGDFPNPNDSLVVEFKGLDDVWIRKWSTGGTTDVDFKQVYIPIFETAFDSLLFANTEFQFRIKNYASLSGNNDWWNIDYVRLDANRLPSSLDTVIRDVAMLYDFPNFLKTYSMLPWDQMQAETDSFTDTIIIPIRDNGQVEGLVAGNFPMNINITNTETIDIIYDELGSNFNAVLGQEIKEHIIFPNQNFTLPIVNADSILFYAEMDIAPVNRNLLLGNDTIKNEILFHNVLAYDDGSAEKAYGLSGGGTEVKQFAYEFKIAKQDTLAAIQIHFSNIDVNVQNLVFSLYAWDSISINSDYANIIGSIENKTPDYIDHKNGFATFVFDTPIIVSNKFYIGWAQIDNRNIQMGYDMNSSKGREHMLVFTSNVWKASTINLAGSPMMRAILDGDYPIPNPTAIQTVLKKRSIKVYPNPTHTVLNISVPQTVMDYSVLVFDYTGKQVFNESNIDVVDVASFNKGIYFLRIEDNKNGQIYNSKFVKK